MFASKEHHYAIAGELEDILNVQVRYPPQFPIDNERDFTPYYIQLLQAGRVRRRNLCREKTPN